MTNRTNRKKVVIYAGSDISTLRTLNRIVPQMEKMGVKPVMIFPDVPVSKNPNAHSDYMKEFTFYDRTLLQNTIIPFIDSYSTFKDVPLTVGGAKETSRKRSLYTPKQLSTLYNTCVGEIKDVNSSDHYSRINDDKDIIGAISLRCLQIFHEPLIQLYKERGFLWNVHPGKLPEYRGLLPIFRAMAEGDSTIQWTLHNIDDLSIDTGSILGETSQFIDPEVSVVGHYNRVPDSVAAMITSKLGDVISGKELDRLVQNKREGAYYSIPSLDAVNKFNEAGGLMVDKDERGLTHFMGSFFRDSEKEGLCAELQKNIRSAVSTFNKSKGSTPLIHSQQQGGDVSRLVESAANGNSSVLGPVPLIV